MWTVYTAVEVAKCDKEYLHTKLKRPDSGSFRFRAYREIYRFYYYVCGYLFFFSSVNVFSIRNKLRSSTSGVVSGSEFCSVGRISVFFFYAFSCCLPNNWENREHLHNNCSCDDLRFICSAAIFNEYWFFFFFFNYL